MNKEKLVKIITIWLYKNYGESESLEPCYNIEDLADFILNNIEILGDDNV